MSNAKPNPELIDNENPELKDEFFADAKSAKEALPENVFAKLTAKRGPQREPTKQPISIRLSPEVVEYFRSTGKGWQSRMDEILLEHVKTQTIP